jgi:hypothetical protein
VTPFLPSMRGWFMPPCSTLYDHTTAPVKDAARNRAVVRRREVACSAVCANLWQGRSAADCADLIAADSLIPGDGLRITEPDYASVGRTEAQA